MIRTKPLLYATVMLALCPPVAAQGDIYQWRDDSGAVHFGARPPESAQESTPAQPVNLPLTVVPVERQGETWCGQARTPTATKELRDYLVALTQLALSLDQPGSHYQYYSHDEQRCLSRWAGQVLEQYRNDITTYAAEYEQLLLQHQRHAASRNKCPNVASGWLVGDDAQQWHDCHIPLDRKLKKLESRLRTLHPIHRYWQETQQQRAEGIDNHATSR